MKRFFLAAILAALTLIAVSPLLRAAGRRAGPPAAKPATVTAAKVTTTTTTTATTGSKKKVTVATTLKTASGKPIGKYAQLKAKRLARGGFCYAGAIHNCWTQRYFDPAWRLWFLYDPNTDAWYFWHPTLRVYLPISYLL